VTDPSSPAARSPGTPRPPRDSYDSPWKETSERSLPDLMALLFPHIHAEIDWSRGYESLDKELAQVVRDADHGRRLADKLFRVYRRDGEPEIVHLHVEVQGQPEAGFPERFFVYYYRIFDYRGGPVVSLAILADADPDWRPGEYTAELWGCSVRFEFPVAKLWDYNERWEELEASSNPFATVVMAHLKTKTTRHDPRERLRWKLWLTRRLYEKGWPRQQILDLFWFIDWVMRLPEDLDRSFKDEIERFEEEKDMRYVTSIERLSRQEGIRQGEASLIERQLRRRFVDLPKWVFERLEKASREELERWGERVLEARRLEDVFSPT